MGLQRVRHDWATFTSLQENFRMLESIVYLLQPLENSQERTTSTGETGLSKSREKDLGALGDWKSATFSPHLPSLIIWSLSELEKPNRLSMLKLVQVREGGRTFSKSLNEVKKKQAWFIRPRHFYSSISHQRRPKSIVLDSLKIKVIQLRAPRNLQDAEVVVRTLTFSDTESMSRQILGYG